MMTTSGRHKLTYRKGVIGVVTDDEKNFLVIQSVDYKENEWRFPGGGVEEGESAKDALERELFEELGTKSFNVIKESKMQIKYNWTEEVVNQRLREEGKTYLGQIQKQYLVKFNGTKDEIVLNPSELRRYKWVNFTELKVYLKFPNQFKNAEKTIREFKII